MKIMMTSDTMTTTSEIPPDTPAKINRPTSTSSPTGLDLGSAVTGPDGGGGGSERPPTPASRSNTEASSAVSVPSRMISLMPRSSSGDAWPPWPGDRPRRQHRRSRPMFHRIRRERSGAGLRCPTSRCVRRERPRRRLRSLHSTTPARIRRRGRRQRPDRGRGTHRGPGVRSRGEPARVQSIRPNAVASRSG